MGMFQQRTTNSAAQVIPTDRCYPFASFAEPGANYWQSRASMRVPTLSMLLLTGSISAFAQSQFPPAAIAPPTQLDDIRQHRCDIQVPEGFSCAVLFDV